MPSTIDDFSHSELGAPLTYAQSELMPGSDAPMSLPVFSVPSGFSARLGQSSIQTVLALVTSSHTDGGSSGVAPPMDMEDSPLLETGLPGCLYSRRTADVRSRMENRPLAYSFITHGSWSLLVRRGRLASCTAQETFWVDQLGKKQAMVAAVNLHRDAGIMLSNRQILSQFATSLSRMSSEIMDLGIGQMVFPHDEVVDLSPAPRATRAAKYMSAMGLWCPQTGQTDSGPVLASTCRSCMSCEYCFPEDRLPPE